MKILVCGNGASYALLAVALAAEMGGENVEFVEKEETDPMLFELQPREPMTDSHIQPDDRPRYLSNGTVKHRGKHGKRYF